MEGKRSLAVTVAGCTLPIHTAASEEEVQTAVKLVENRLEEVTHKHTLLSQQAILLVAMNLANEIIRLQKETDQFKSSIQQKSQSLLAELDQHFGFSLSK